MVLVTIDSSKGSLQTASWSRHISAATFFLFFSLPYVCVHNSDKRRDHSVGISTSSSVNSFQWRFSLVKQWVFFPPHKIWNNGQREYKFVTVVRCHIQNVVYQFDKQVTKANSFVQWQNSALEPEIICIHDVSRGRNIWIIYDLLNKISILWSILRPFRI